MSTFGPNGAMLNSIIGNIQSSQNVLSDSMRKLSTGLRITKASDDPGNVARLSTMRGNIGGLQTANKNVQDAISFLSLRESAMSQVSSILMRLRDLSMRASNGATMTSESRSILQKEADKLLTAINNINFNSKFNGVKLFQKTAQEVPGGSGGLIHPGQSFISVDLAAMAVGGVVTIYGAWYDGAAAFPDFNLLSPDGTEAFGYLYETWSTLPGVETYIGGSGPATVLNGAPSSGAPGTMGSATKIVYSGWAGYNGAGGWDEESFVVTNPAPGNWTIIIDNEQPVPKNFGLYFNEPASAPEDVTDEIFVSSHTIESEVSVLHLGAFEIGTVALSLGVNLSSQSTATSSISSIDTALDTLSSYRTGDGTSINRFNSILNSNNVQLISLEMSRSSIQDLDMAAGSTEFVKQQIMLEGAYAAFSHNVSKEEVAKIMMSELGML